MNFNMDRSFFVVISALPKGGLVQREIDLDWDRATVLKMARDGQFDEVHSIIETNPVEGTVNVIAASEIFDECSVEIFTTLRGSSHHRSRDPHREHRIDARLAGVGPFGPFGA
jgi:hypothetical protein